MALLLVIRHSRIARDISDILHAPQSTGSRRTPHEEASPKYRYWILCLYSGSVAFCLDLNITRHKVDASDYHNKFTRPSA